MEEIDIRVEKMAHELITISNSQQMLELSDLYKRGGPPCPCEDEPEEDFVTISKRGLDIVKNMPFVSLFEDK